jgi:hypothetical protein
MKHWGFIGLILFLFGGNPLCAQSHQNLKITTAAGLYPAAVYTGGSVGLESIDLQKPYRTNTNLGWYHGPLSIIDGDGGQSSHLKLSHTYEKDLLNGYVNTIVVSLVAATGVDLWLGRQHYTELHLYNPTRHEAVDFDGHTFLAGAPIQLGIRVSNKAQSTVFTIIPFEPTVGAFYSRSADARRTYSHYGLAALEMKMSLSVML